MSGALALALALTAQAGACATGQTAVPAARAACSVPSARADGLSFSFSAADYAPGEALSQKGAVGAAWAPLAADASATGVVEGVERAVDFATSVTGGVSLVANESASSNDFRQVDFRFSTAALSEALDFTPDAVAMLSPGLAADGGFCYLGWCDGAWRELRTPAGWSGEESAPAGMIDGRIELKTVADARYASYLVKAGETWTRLKTSDGRSWFATRHEQARTACGVAGRGRLSSLAASTDETQNTTTYYWIGGGAGDWNVATNWSLAPGGVAAANAPNAAGDAGVVAGRVEIARGDEKAIVSGAVVAFDESGKGEMIGGDVGGAPALDTDRPRAGKALSAMPPTIFGRSPDYTYRWYRANYDKKTFSWRQDGASFTPQTSDYEHWLRLIVKDGATDVSTNTIFFSKLPVCYLTTDDGKSPSSKKEEHDGRVRVQGGEEHKFQYDGAMEIKVRGNTTASANKKPYKLKLGKKANMFGYGENKHWVLLANAFDSTSQRNKLAYDLANDIGVLGMDSTWVVCTLNGSYLGLYQFCEHIRPAANRVPVYDWEDASGKVAEKFAEKHGLTGDQEDELADFLEKDLNWVTDDRVSYVTNGIEVVDKPSKLWKKYTNDITSGYILEFSTENDEVTTFNTSAGNLNMRTMGNAPEYLCSNSTMAVWVKGLMKDYWGACTSANRTVPSASGHTRKGRHYSEFCDVGSMVGFTLVNELFTNQDASQKSRYCYIQDGKITWGPVWDFDWGSGGIKVSSDAKPYGVTNGWIAAKSANRNSMIAEWSADFYFCQKLYEAYWANRARFQQIVAPNGDMDECIAYINEAAVENDKKWNGSSRKFGADNAILRENLTARLKWLDKQFSSVTNLMESFRSSAQSSQSTWDPEAKSEPTTDAQGRAVPAVPLEWVRESNVGADPSFAYATERRLKNAVTNAPSAWGKPTPLWEDYVAGTNPDPNGTNAVFMVSEIAITNGVPYLKWTPDLGVRRAYKVWGCETLGGDWHERREGDRFFKVDVALP